MCSALDSVHLAAGRLVASLIVDFLQVFNLDFSLAVFQPETNLVSLTSDLSPTHSCESYVTVCS